nr:hypothetical protein [uncultured Desulfuromonas sp.]
MEKIIPDNSIEKETNDIDNGIESSEVLTSNLESSSPESSSLVGKILQNSALIIATITAVTYFFGYAVYHGYLSYWGLLGSMFPISMEETIIHGVMKSCLLGIDKWGYFSKIIFIFFAFYLVMFILFFDKPFQFVSKLFSKENNEQSINERHRFLLSDFFKFLLRLLVVVLVILSVPLTYNYAYEQGKDSAFREQKKILNGEAANIPFKSIRLSYSDQHGHVKSVKAYPLAVSASHQAFYVNTDVVVLPANRILEIRNIGGVSNP